MFEIRDYVRVKSLEEAWTLNQKKANRVLGGMLWMKLGRGRIDTAIDLSDLQLNQIEETEQEFRIGCMTTLRQLELSEALNQYADYAVRDALCQIVGVQFRNLATVGGSVWGRYGFSDVLTIFMALGAEAELYRGGRVPLEAFVNQRADRDILTHIVLPKERARYAYLCMRNTKTDLPVLNVAAALGCREAGGIRLVVGARPQKAMLLRDEEGILRSEDGLISLERAEKFAAYAAGRIPTGSNLRGSAAYRTRLVRVLTKRVLLKAEKATAIKTEGAE